MNVETSRNVSRWRWHRPRSVWIDGVGLVDITYHFADGTASHVFPHANGCRRRERFARMSGRVVLGCPCRLNRMVASLDRPEVFVELFPSTDTPLQQILNEIDAARIYGDVTENPYISEHRHPLAEEASSTIDNPGFQNNHAAWGMLPAEPQSRDEQHEPRVSPEAAMVAAAFPRDVVRMVQDGVHMDIVVTREMADQNHFTVAHRLPGHSLFTDSTAALAAACSTMREQLDQAERQVLAQQQQSCCDQIDARMHTAIVENPHHTAFGMSFRAVVPGSLEVNYVRDLDDAPTFTEALAALEAHKARRGSA